MMECLNCLDGKSIVLKSGIYDWVKCGECGRRPDCEMSLEGRVKFQIEYVQSKLDCAVKALEKIEYNTGGHINHLARLALEEIKK